MRLINLWMEKHWKGKLSITQGFKVADNKKKEETMNEVELLKKQIQEEVKEKYNSV